MDSLKQIVNLIFFVDIEDGTRKRRTVDARRAYSRILKDVGFSYEHIGHSLNKNHATIIHYLNSIDDLLKYDSVFERKFMLAKRQFLLENSYLMSNSKDDIYAVAIGLENRLENFISKKNKIIEILNDYEKNNGKNDCIDYCREAVLPLFDS
jgi:hypothetical protein